MTVFVSFTRIVAMTYDFFEYRYQIYRLHGALDEYESLTESELILFAKIECSVSYEQACITKISSKWPEKLVKIFFFGKTNCYEMFKQ